MNEQTVCSLTVESPRGIVSLIYLKVCLSFISIIKGSYYCPTKPVGLFMTSFPPWFTKYRTCPRELAVDLLLEVHAELDFDLVPRGTPPMVAWDYNTETVGLREGGGGGKEFGDGGSDGTVPLGAVGGGGVILCKAAHNTQANYTS